MCIFIIFIIFIDLNPLYYMILLLYTILQNILVYSRMFCRYLCSVFGAHVLKQSPFYYHYSQDAV